MVQQKFYNTCIKFYDFLKKPEDDLYRKLQRERAFYLFLRKGQPEEAKRIFMKYSIGIEYVFLLFSSLFGEHYVKLLVSQMSIDVSELQYYNPNDINKSANNRDMVQAAKVFLTYFMTKAREFRSEEAHLRNDEEYLSESVSSPQKVVQLARKTSEQGPSKALNESFSEKYSKLSLL